MGFSTLDPKTASREQVRAEIDRLEALANNWKNEEQAIKLAINSIYGGLGNKYFVAHNSDVAESVTLQGQDLIKFAEQVMNDYFWKWHTMTELHECMGIVGEVRPVKKAVNVYSDTDSCYISFEEVLMSCDWPGDPKDFILLINKLDLTNHLKAKFDEYAEKLGVVNYQDFELENISESGIWLAKKKYMLDKVWESGIDIEARSQITYKGIELAQSVTPPFARKKMKGMVDYIFEKKKDLQIREMMKMLKEFKSEFKLAEPEEISMGRGINDYSRHVLNDSTKIEVAKGCPIQIRASAVYNYMLNQDSGAKQKYEMIKTGTKVKFYYAKTQKNRPKQMDPIQDEVFAFIPGAYPYEFALPIDYDVMFGKTVIDPLNRILKSIGLPMIEQTLFVRPPLF
jgi:DNA polymerase elongation subunit (family B)